MDFKLEKMALQWLAIARGHRVIYGVRFNSECATVEAMWAYIVSVLRQILDGKAATLVTNVVSYLAHIVKPDVAGRLFNRPTEPEPECCQWQLYTLAVGAYLSLAAGLSAESVFALQRAYSGFSNTKASTAGHARSSRSRSWAPSPRTHWGTRTPWATTRRRTCGGGRLAPRRHWQHVRAVVNATGSTSSSF